MKSPWLERVEKKQLAKYMENVPKPKQRVMTDYANKLGVIPPENRVGFLNENQHLANEMQRPEEGEWLNALYNRVSVAAAKKIYEPANFMIDNLVSVQPMSGPTGKVKFLRFRYSSDKKVVPELNSQSELPEINLCLEDEECIAKTRSMKTEFPVFIPTLADGLQHYYDKFYLTKDFCEAYPEVKEFMEDEMASYMADKLTDEIHVEILTDLRNNAGTVAKFDFTTALGDTPKEKYESLYIKIVEISGIIHRKTLRGGCNWIVTSPEIAKVFTDAITYFDWKRRDARELCFHGTMNNRWRLYSSKSLPKNNMLLGYKGDNVIDAGYFYNPYIPMTPLKKAEGQLGTLCRYSKKLLREGAKFYAKMTVEGFE